MANFLGIGRGGDWSFSEAIAKAFSGTVGILTAIAVDYIQKGGESALFFMTRVVNEYALSRFNVEAVPPILYVALLVAAGFALVFIFEPDNKRNAFYAGAGVLGFLATFSPVQPTAIDVAPAPSAEFQDLGPEASLMNGVPVIKAAWRPFQQTKKYDLAADTRLPLRVLIRFPASQSSGSLPSIYAALHDFKTGKTYKLGSGGQLVETREGPVVVFDMTIMADDDGASALANLGLRVEAQGYKVGYAETNVSRGDSTPVDVSVSMETSNLPLAIERLRFPRKF